MKNTYYKRRPLNSSGPRNPLPPALRRAEKTESAANCACLPPIRTRRILVPIDFTEGSYRAFWYAIFLARLLKGSLVLLYVAETSPPGSELSARHSTDLEADLRTSATKQLARLRKEVPTALSCQTRVRAGRPDSEILEAAASLGADLIVLAARSQQSHPGQLGTTAGRVASLAPCPVLLVPVTERTVPFFL
jgi:nucleotide-binding universal stress UspA family protein